MHIKKLWLAIAIITAMLYSCSAHGQAFKKSTIIEISAVAGSIAADGYTTPWNRYKEINPVARPFISSTAGRTLYFGGSFGAVLLSNKILIHHTKARHILNWSIVTVETGWAVNNIITQRKVNSDCALWRASGQPIPNWCL